MKILAVSEHFLPRIAGTSEYVLQTCSALAQAGHDIHLLIPGDSAEDAEITEYPFRITALGVNWPAKEDPTRTVRYRFCEKVSDYAEESAKNGSYEVLHVLFGLFVAEELDTEKLKEMGLPCLLTVHNVPPQECRRSWAGDFWLNQVKDRARVSVMAWKNQSRLKQKDFAAYIVPCEIVEKLLSSIKTDALVKVVPHGISEELCRLESVPSSRVPKPASPIRLLTVGGWMPHKRQHLIPSIASSLKKEGIDFVWDLAGPTRRSPRYQSSILTEIKKLSLVDHVKVLGPVPEDRLAQLYSEANLYIQPSTEEGFCITALNAAGFGIPVIGSPAGAIPDISRISRGALAPSNVRDISKAIFHFIMAGLWEESSEEVANQVREQYTWLKSAQKLADIYSSLA